MSDNLPEATESQEIRALHGRILTESQELSRLRDDLSLEVRQALEEEIGRLQSELDERIAAEAEPRYSGESGNWARTVVPIPGIA